MVIMNIDPGRIRPGARPQRLVRSHRSCRRCGEHAAVFIRLGEARRDREHPLCPRCWQSELDRNAARLLLAS